MDLPKLTVPTFTTKIPSSKKKVKYRPFLSKEEKILMMVKQADDSEVILQAMKDIINVCTFEKLGVDKLAIFDIEYLFLQLRAKSIGEIIEIDMKCNNEVEMPKADDHPAGVGPEMKPCGGLIPFAINIEDIKVNIPKDHSPIINLESNIGITLRYPSLDDLKMIDDNEDNDIEIITNLLDSVFDEYNVYEASDTSKEDIDEFMGNINHRQLEQIRETFFYTMPTLEYTVKYKCSKCGYKGEYTFRGINDFF